jgi:lactoylglutathione lyase
MAVTVGAGRFHEGTLACAVADAEHAFEPAIVESLLLEYEMLKPWFVCILGLTFSCAADAKPAQTQSPSTATAMTQTPPTATQSAPNEVLPPWSNGHGEPLPRVGFVSFAVANLDRSLDFYVRVMGMSEQLRIPLPTGVMEIVLGYPDAPGRAAVVLMYDDKRAMPYEHGDAFSRFGLIVSGIDALIARLQQEGLTVITPPTASDSLKLTYALIRDPDDYVIELLQDDALAPPAR